jgi:hypothetical protein
MIGRGFGAVRKSGPAAGRRRRSAANSASGRTRTSRKRPCPGSRDTRAACRRGQASASERRAATDASRFTSRRRPVSRSLRVAVAGRSRPTAAAGFVTRRPARATPCEARTCRRRTLIVSGWPVTEAQLGFRVATRGSVNTRVTGSTTSASATGAAGAGSLVGVASTSEGAGGSGATGTSAEAVVSEAPDSAAGAGSGACSVAAGAAVGSSSAGIPAVGSSS